MRSYRAGSDPWNAQLRLALVDALGRVEGKESLSFSVTERYRNPPPELSATGTDIGWYFEIKNGVVACFATTPRVDADVSVELDYDLFEHLAAFLIASDPKRQEAFQVDVAAASEADRLRARGGLNEEAQRVMAIVHDTMARLTAHPGRPKGGDGS